MWSVKMRRRQAGITMIEVLVSLLILMTGLLGLIMLSTNAVQFTDQADQRSTATTLAYSMADWMRANVDGRGGYVVAFEQTPALVADCADTACSAADLARFEVVGWKNMLADSLSGGDGAVTLAGGGQVMTVQVRWTEGAATRNFQLVVEFEP